MDDKPYIDLCAKRIFGGTWCTLPHGHEGSCSGPPATEHQPARLDKGRKK